MRYLAAFSLVALLVVVGCSSMKAYIDYDRDVDFAQYKTFAYKETADLSVKDSSELMHRRMVSAIKSKLKAGGMQEVTSNPDLYFTYLTDEREEMQLNTTNYGYGYGGGWYRSPYWGGGGMSSSHTTVTKYTKGTLVVDAWDPKTKNLVWRGTVESVVSENPEKASADIDKAIEALSKEWQ